MRTSGTPSRRRRGIDCKRAIGFLVAVAALVVAAEAPAAQPMLPPELEALRAKLEIYRDPVRAIHDGYFSTLGCVQYPDGAMGIHFLNPGLIGPEPDPMTPQILLYMPDESGALRLVGAEWFIPLATGVDRRPEIHGQPFEGPMEGHAPLLPRSLHHYDLHVWLFEDNPAGLFAHAHPGLSCLGNWPYALELEEAAAVPAE